MHVNLGNIEYKIYIGNNFDAFDTYLEENRISEKILVVSDGKVLGLYGDEFKGRIKNKYVLTYNMIGGEKNKNLSAVKDIYDICISNDFTRNSAIIALGGGVVGDTAGFAACTFMRGIKFVQVPTTLVSDVDSSIGGKVGVNYKNIKNMIGALYHPDFIYVNTSALKTLEKRQIISGIAEIIKYSILFDANFFDYLNSSMNGLLSLENDKLNYVIRECIGFKLKAVKNDVRDDKEHQLLNFGHTIGHALESVSGYSISHGEAVALGMMFESAISYGCGILPRETLMAIFRLIRKSGLGGRLEIEDMSQLLEIMKHDKKTENGNLKFILPESIGNCSISTGISNEKIVKAYELLKDYWG